MIDADEIRDRFIWYKRLTVPYFKMPPGSNEEAFQKAAKLCNELKASADDFVAVQFDCSKEVYPGYLHTEISKNNYLEYKAQRDQVNEGELDRWMYYLKCNIEGGRSVEETLNDDGLDFPPWFRITCTIEPIKQIVDKYRPLAIRMMTEQLKTYMIKHKLPIERIMPV